MVGANAITNDSTSPAICFIAFSTWLRTRKKQVLCRCSDSWNFRGLADTLRNRCALGAEVLTTSTKMLQAAAHFSGLGEPRVCVEHAQDLVAAQVRHLEQHPLDTSLAIGCERRLVGRAVEHRDR